MTDTACVDAHWLVRLPFVEGMEDRGEIRIPRGARRENESRINDDNSGAGEGDGEEVRLARFGSIEVMLDGRRFE